MNWKKVAKWTLWIIIVISILVFGTHYLYFAKIKPANTSSSYTPSEDGKKQTRASKDDNCKSNPKPIFTAEFADFDKLKQTAPIGAVMAGSPGRAYVMVKGDAMPNGGMMQNRAKTPLYAPTDATIQSLVYARRDPTNPNAPGEYRLEFRISCEVTFNFDHMDEVVDKIKAVSPATPSDRSNDLKYVNIPVKAGELVGYTDGTPMAGSFDLFLLNSTKTVPHINPARWKWDQVVTADCPYDYYTPELKQKYYSILRSLDGQALKTPNCGSPSHDKASSAAGGWFLGDSTDNKGKWLEIATQATTAMNRVEINLRENGSGIFSVRDYKPKMLPEEMKIGDSVCYTDSNNWMFIKLNPDT